jgi:hypothetical protein
MRGIAAAVIGLGVVSVPTFFRSSRFSLGGVSTSSKLPGSPEDARNRLESGVENSNANQNKQLISPSLAENAVCAANFAPFLHFF